MRLSTLTACLAARWLLSALALVVLVPASGKAQGETGRKMLFEIYKDQAGEYRWRLKAANGKIIAVPADAYKSKSAAKEAVENIRKNANSPKWKVEYYQDKQGEFRWRLKAANGALMARSSEGYSGKSEAEKALDLVRQRVKSATVVEK
ncbi:MAG TPA: DUF1508 domain-containing protein [Gemmataceae bacterium]|nr:DUF1508 domain-containing protein [Gemmataceae bacterium]